MNYSVDELLVIINNCKKEKDLEKVSNYLNTNKYKMLESLQLLIKIKCMTLS